MASRCAAALVAAVLSFSAFAESPSTQLDPVVVTATREETPISALSSSVSVITREDIERLQSNDLADLLRGIPGIDVTRSGGPGAPASVFIRGAESNHTLFLIDGVRYTTETFYNAQIQNLTPEAIERIEIVKGPRSALWGSDAVGGVVNIITRRAANGISGDASLRGGSYGTRDLAGRVGYGGSLGRASLSLQSQDFDGYPPLQGSTVNRGHDSLNIAFDGRLKLGDFTLDARHLQAEGTNEYVQFGANRSQGYLNRVTALELGAPLGAGWRTRLIASLAYDTVEQREPGDPARPAQLDFIEVDRRSLEWETRGSLPGTDLIGGLSTSSSRLDNVYYSAFGDGDVRDRTERNAIFLQGSGDIGPVDLLLAVRETDHADFGHAATGNFEAGLLVWDGGRAALAVGNAFKEPELTDLFGPFGNPDLEPERSKSAELNFRQSLGTRQLVTMAIYENRIKDMIEYDPDTFMPFNQHTRIRGIEAGWRFEGESLSAHLSGNLQNPKSEVTGKRLVRRSQQSAQAGISYRTGRIQAGTDVQACGSRIDSNDARMGGYTLLNADLRVKLVESLSLSLRGENLLDKNYELVDGFRTPRSSGYATLRYQF
jgi:vitamin B12 transporter